MTKPSRWGWIVALVALTGAALVLFFLLSITTGNRAVYERHYAWLFWVNVVVAVLLMLVIVVAVVRLQLRVRGGKFGSRLRWCGCASNSRHEMSRSSVRAGRSCFTLAARRAH